MSELSDMIFAQANAMNQQFQTGLKAGKEMNRAAHKALKVAYDAALKDEAVKIPTTLHVAIEQILRLRDEQQINDYANDGVKREQLERHEGRPEHDQDMVGRALRAGM